MLFLIGIIVVVIIIVITMQFRSAKEPIDTKESVLKIKGKLEELNKVLGVGDIEIELIKVSLKELAEKVAVMDDEDMDELLIDQIADVKSELRGLVKLHNMLEATHSEHAAADDKRFDEINQKQNDVKQRIAETLTAIDSFLKK